jgi:hypothetical protein
MAAKSLHWNRSPAVGIRRYEVEASGSYGR